jgi:hypothetical protein
MEYVIAIILIGLIPAAIASSKGYNFFLWWLYGSAIFIVALPHSLLIGPGGLKRKCPFCAETIRSEAIVCPHCQRDLPSPEIIVPDPVVRDPTEERKDDRAVLLWIFVMAVVVGCILLFQIFHS